MAWVRRRARAKPGGVPFPQSVQDGEREAGVKASVGGKRGLDGGLSFC